MSVNIKQNDELVRITGNSIVQADWNDKDNENKVSCIKNQPDTLTTMEAVLANEDDAALAGAAALKELNDSVNRPIVENRTDLMSVAELGKLADALAVKDTFDYYNVNKHLNKSISTLEELLETFGSDFKVPTMTRILDTSGWGPLGYSAWYKIIIIPSDTYTTGQQYATTFNGFIFDTNGACWYMSVKGKKGETATVKYDKINRPLITSSTDLMANTVTGLLPDALAVKDGFKEINDSLEPQFVAISNDDLMDNENYEYSKGGYFKIGKLVIVELRLKTIVDITPIGITNVEKTGTFPRHSNPNGPLSLSCYTTEGFPLAAYIDVAGLIGFYGQGDKTIKAGKFIVICGTYIEN